MAFLNLQRTELYPLIPQTSLCLSMGFLHSEGDGVSPHRPALNSPSQPNAL